MKSLFFFFALVLSLPVARAADSSVSAPSAAPAAAEAPAAETSSTGIGGLKKFEANDKITDNELKSREGSLTQFSLKANVSYYGPTLTDMSITNQPNLDGAVTGSAVGPSGSVGARYRFDPTSSMTLNAGFTDQYLFTGKQSTLDVNNPYITYDKSFKIGGVQLVTSPGITLVTSNVYRPAGERLGLDARAYASYNLGTSPFSIGTSFTGSYYIFDRDYVPDHVVGFSKGKPVIQGDGKIRQISITVAPVVKYNMTSKLNINTSWGFNFFNPRYYESPVKMNSRVVNEWIGVGYAVSRDIYINPYIQFYPTQFTWKTATMNINTVFSIL